MVRLIALGIEIYPGDEYVEDYGNDGGHIEEYKGTSQREIVDLWCKNDPPFILTFGQENTGG